MIVFDHVSKVYSNGTVGLDDVNLTIQDGEFGSRQDLCANLFAGSG